MDKAISKQLPTTAAFVNAVEGRELMGYGVYIGEGLPSVPPKIAKKIRSGYFVEMVGRIYCQKCILETMPNQKQKGVHAVHTTYLPDCRALEYM